MVLPPLGFSFSFSMSSLVSLLVQKGDSGFTCYYLWCRGGYFMFGWGCFRCRILVEIVSGVGMFVVSRFHKAGS